MSKKTLLFALCAGALLACEAVTPKSTDAPIPERHTEVVVEEEPAPTDEPDEPVDEPAPVGDLEVAKTDEGGVAEGGEHPEVDKKLAVKNQDQFVNALGNLDGNAVSGESGSMGIGSLGLKGTGRGGGEP